jgi:hypothetical protein
MLKRGKPRPEEGCDGHYRVRFLLAAIVIAASACEERERLTFPSAPDPSDEAGPLTVIDRPNVFDTTVAAGPEFFVNGQTIDPDGVDTVYFLVIGGSDNIPPFRPNPPSDTVRFGVPITTSGNVGDTITVRIHGVDRAGNQGAAASRRIFVQ